jgi:2-dehydro-3-deoxyglucarate aldolase
MCATRNSCLALFLFSCLVLPALAQNAQQLETIKRIKNNEVTFGTWVYLKDPTITELMARAGFDWLILDMEHGVMNEEMVQNLMMPLNGSKCVPIVRPWKNDADVIGKVIDTGAMGIIIHMVNTPEEAEKGIKACYYPPRGNRGMGYARLTGFGQREHEYLKIANEAMLVVIMIETKVGVENIEKILAVPGIDVVLVGTFDLAADLGHLGEFDHPAVLAAKKKVEDACKRRRIPIASWANDKKGIEKAVQAGAHFIALGGDADFIWQTSEKLVKDGHEVKRGAGKK